VVVLLGIGFLAGVVTAISPCVLPVLPILLAGSTTGGRRRPYAIIAGLVASFSVFTLFAASLLNLLGLPQDFLRSAAIVLLFVVAASLVFPQVASLLERPFLALTRRPSRDLGGGFLLGASLGLVFVPCAGPVLAAMSVVAANHRVGTDAFLLTLAYASGAALPMLLVALAGQRASERTRLLRMHAQKVRRVLGVVMAATALAIALNVDRHFQTFIPGYTSALQERIERNSSATSRLAALKQSDPDADTQQAASGEPLDDFGAAPDFKDISLWLNTPGGRPLSLEKLRGKVVLVDFWTYSCINCLRTLPFVKAWDETYRKDGLVIVGVHSPEFAFERVSTNVREAVSRLGIRYPVALDNEFGTWNAYSNQYWPAKYLLDRRGHVRFAHFGEGEYERTEGLIRRLLAERGGKLPRPVAKEPERRRLAVTAETYLGYERLGRYVGTPVSPDVFASYRLPRSLDLDELAYGGGWRVAEERITAGRDARLRLHFLARDVHLVLGGRGTVQVYLDGAQRRSVRVAGSRLYTLLRQEETKEALLELRVTPGLSAYAFTFG